MLKKLQPSFLFIIFTSGLLILEGQVFAQNSDKSQPTIQEVSQEQQEKLDPAEEEEHHETRDLEKLLKSYNKDQEKVLNDASKINNIVNEESSTEISETDIETMNPSGKKETNPSKKKERIEVNKNMSLSDSARISLGPLQKLSEAQLLKILKENTKDSPVRPYMDEFPNLTLLTVRLIKDKESIPSLLMSLENKERLIHFSGWLLGTFVIGFLLKRFFHRPDRSFLGAVGIFFLRFYIMLFLRFGLFYFYFHKELKPAFAVVKKTLLQF